MPKRRKHGLHPLYPEPGAWVLGRVAGMPEIQPPGPLPGGLLDNETVRDTVEYEGLGVCIIEYIPADRIKSTKLRLLWKAARSAMRAVVEELDQPEPRQAIKGLHITKAKRGL